MNAAADDRPPRFCPRCGRELEAMRVRYDVHTGKEVSGLACRLGHFEWDQDRGGRERGRV